MEITQNSVFFILRRLKFVICCVVVDTDANRSASVSKKYISGVGTTVGRQGTASLVAFHVVAQENARAAIDNADIESTTTHIMLAAKRIKREKAMEIKKKTRVRKA